MRQDEGYIFVCGMPRSGTTLVTTILDSHPDVSMAYEIFPGTMPPADTLLSMLVRAAETYGQDALRCASTFREPEVRPVRLFCGHMHRSGLCMDEVVSIVREASSHGIPFGRGPSSVQVGLMVAKHKRDRDGTTRCGFKIHHDNLLAFRGSVGPARWVCVIRDPRDAIASRMARNIPTKIDRLIQEWKAYADQSIRLREKHPDEAMIVQYENLAHNPDTVIGSILEHCGLSPSEDARRFYESKATVHRGGSDNGAKLKRDVFTDAIGRWRHDITEVNARRILSECGELAGRLRYGN